MTSNQPSRRSILMSSAAAVSTAAVSTLISRSAHAAATDTLRIGMVGCGGRCSGAALDALEADPGTRLVAMCDLFPDRIQDKLNSLKTQKPNQVEVDKDHCFTGLDGHKKVIDSVDVVLIACAAKFHPMYVKAAIDAGKHVFTEKPHGIDPPGIRMIADACNLAKQKNLSVVSGLHRRFDPAMQETIKRIHDGAIGDIVAIEENFIRGPYGTLFRAPGLSEIQYQYSNQYRFGWLCGDDVTQSLVHNLDSALWAMKEQNPVKAHGFAGRSSCFDKPFIYGDVFDHHSVVYQFANGVRMYANCRTQPNCFNEVSGIIMGTKGVAYTESYIIQGENKWKYSGQAQNPYRVEHVELFKSIRAAKPINCGDYMCRSTLTAIMGQLACYTGQQLTWDQVSKSDYHIGPRPDQCTWDMQPPVKPDAEGIYPIPIPGKTQLA